MDLPIESTKLNTALSAFSTCRWYLFKCIRIFLVQLCRQRSLKFYIIISLTKLSGAMEVVEFGTIPKVETVEANSCPLGVALVDEHRTNKFSDPNDIVALAAQVQKADEFIRANAGSKLRVIAEQIKFLQKQAKEALYVAKRDNDLHHAACNMVKKPGRVYYLYERPSGQRYFSMLSPQEWGSSLPHPFVGAYKLEYDQSWTAFDDIAKREEEDALFDKILNARIAITDGDKMNADNSSATKPHIEEV